MNRRLEGKSFRLEPMWNWIIVAPSMSRNSKAFKSSDLVSPTKQLEKLKLKILKRIFPNHKVVSKVSIWKHLLKHFKGPIPHKIVLLTSKARAAYFFASCVGSTVGQAAIRAGKNSGFTHFNNPAILQRLNVLGISKRNRAALRQVLSSFLSGTKHYHLAFSIIWKPLANWILEGVKYFSMHFITQPIKSQTLKN